MSLSRWRMDLDGRVQGIGFRPWVWRLATELGLHGFVCNTPSGVRIEVQGSGDQLQRFAACTLDQLPELARIDNRRITEIPVDSAPSDSQSFRIEPSLGRLDSLCGALPDLAPCQDCSSEMFDRANRRFLYPLISCTRCGPRYSIQRSAPFDRQRTTLESFPLCRSCQQEYTEPTDRRFHAQTIGCFECGPVWTWKEPDSEPWVCNHPGAVESMQARFLKVIQAGQVVLVKGVGGYQFMCDATDEQAVDRLRHIKRREHKPFALLLGSLQQASRWTELSGAALCELQAAHRPIVVSRRIARAEGPSGGLGSEIGLARSVSNFDCSLGVMLPNNPMQYLLTRSLESPLVLTSANDSAEPMLIDDSQVLERFAHSVGGILSHNRTIVQSLEDPIVGDTSVGLIPVRLGRGNAPCRLEIASLASSPLVARPAIAMGADLKAAWAMGDSQGIRLMEPLGDASHPEVYARLERSVQGALDAQASIASNASTTSIVTDLHPGYQTTQLGAKLSRRGTRNGPAVHCTAIQHHGAHLGALALDLGIALEERFLGFVFDGTGYGGPAEVWGGELIAIEGHEMTRLGRLRPFRLPKGDVSARNPWRSALGLLTDAGIGFEEVRASCDWAQRSPWAQLSEAQRCDYVRLATSQEHSVLSSSMGRWLDAICSLLGLVHVSHYEGHAPMMLEDRATRYAIDIGADRLRNLGRIEQDAQEYRFTIARQGSLYEIDGRGVLARVLGDLRNGIGVGCIAYRVHGAIAQLLVDTLGHLASPWAESRRVGLTGGVFQNRLLVELADDRLARAGWQALFHRRIPPNDSGIAAGQLRLLGP